ncbi:vascular endothelial growth factor B [Leptodactylus fuscus]|uniref:vascular endothelial growth factor B n=1 Tax=Leptodactylus fuscus TaxID=238119 RepID=UPI003F4EF6EC
MDYVIGGSLVWLSVLLHCILTPISVSQTQETQKVEGQGWMDIFNRSKCQPRWVLLNLLNEFPQFSDFLFKPPCVSVQRCAGCCLDEAQSCFPLQSHIIKMQVQVYKTKSDSEYTEISVIQHTECECRRPHVNLTLKASRLSAMPNDKKFKKRRRKGRKGKGASKNARSACPPCARRRTLNPKTCECICELSEEKCTRRGLTQNKERCRCEKPRS